MCVCVYIYIYMCVCVHIYIYIYAAILAAFILLFGILVNEARGSFA
jgi:hypothetical protein